MNRRLKVVAVTLGDPFRKSSHSGVNYNVFSRLQKKCELVGVFDLDLRGARKSWLALISSSPNRRRSGEQTSIEPPCLSGPDAISGV